MSMKVKSYLKISDYKMYREKLMVLMYPGEFVNAGRVVFKTNTPYKGLEGRLWQDQIYIDFPEAFNSNLADITSKIHSNSIYSDKYYEYSFTRQRLTVNPNNKFSFPDTIEGMKQRAAYFVLIFDICLKCFISTNDKTNNII